MIFWASSALLPELLFFGSTLIIIVVYFHRWRYRTKGKDLELLLVCRAFGALFVFDIPLAKGLCSRFRGRRAVPSSAVWANSEVSRKETIEFLADEIGCLAA